MYMYGVLLAKSCDCCIVILMYVCTSFCFHLSSSFASIWGIFWGRCNEHLFDTLSYWSLCSHHVGHSFPSLLLDSFIMVASICSRVLSVVSNRFSGYGQCPELDFTVRCKQRIKSTGICISEDAHAHLNGFETLCPFVLISTFLIQIWVFHHYPLACLKPPIRSNW